MDTKVISVVRALRWGADYSEPCTAFSNPKKALK